MIKFLLSISLLSILPAQAMDRPPAEEGRHLGRYPLYQEGDDSAVKGNATLFQIKGKLVGITCAHCVPYLNSLAFISTDEIKYNDVFSRISLSSIEDIKIHHLYKQDEKEHTKENAKYDIALFTIKGNSKLKYFEGEISTEDLKEQESYTVDVKSYGPLFAKDSSSYEDGVFHQLYSPLKFSKEGLLFHPFQARDFYLSFQPMQGGTFILEYGLLSSLEDVNLLSGDSGSLAVISDGKAIAIASAVDRDISKLLQIDHFLKEFSKFEKIDEVFKNSLLLEVESKIANPTQLLKQTSGKEIFVFKLKEGIPSIEGNDYYTPLVSHFQFINEYVDNIKVNSNDAHKEIHTTQINRELCEDPELTGKYCDLINREESLKTIASTLAAEMTPQDKVEADAFLASLDRTNNSSSDDEQ